MSHPDCPPIEVVPCDPPFSFYAEADRYEAPLHNHPLHRTFSLARKLRVRTLVRQNISADQWLLQENDVVSKVVGAQCTSSAWRLSFFREPFSHPEDIQEVPADSYIGYLVVVRTQTPVQDKPLIVFVREAIIEAPALLNNYIHSSGRFVTRLAGRDFSVAGSYFCQQNGVTGLCAHAALRTILTDLSLPRKPPVTDAQINQAVGLVPGRDPLGLNPVQIVGALKAFGFNAVCHDFFEDPVVEYGAFVHPFLESGLPALLAFSLEEAREGHIVAVIGHTLNTDLWYPEARLGYPLVFPSRKYFYTPACYWVDNLIVQDDNYGIYTCVSTRCLSKATLPHLDPRSRCLYAFGVLPRRSNRGPVNAEYNAVIVLTTELEFLQHLRTPWLHELKRAALDPSRGPVVRTLLMSREEYAKHAEGLEDQNGGRLSEPYVAVLRAMLPPRFWMVELTIPDLYTANRSKLGELLFDLKRPSPRDPVACWVGGRLPGVFYVPATRPDVLPDPLHSAIEGHVKMYRAPSPVPMAPEW